MCNKYKETSNLIRNENARRNIIYVRPRREISIYIVLCMSVFFISLLLLWHMLSSHNISPKIKQMRRVNLAKPDRVSNKFANWSNQDLDALFMSSLGGCESVGKNSTILYEDDLPDALDWRQHGVISEVIAQRDCNICWQISIVQVMESMAAISKGSRVTPLSIQELFDCSYSPTCGKGNPHMALIDMIKKNMSIVTEEQYPLSLRKEQCPFVNRPYPKGVMVKDFQVYCDVTDKQVMKLITHGPVIAAVDSNLWVWYNGGIVSQHCYKRLNHVVQIVGYDRTGEVPYYIVKNSWGTDFGDDGYIYIEMGKNLCGIEMYIISLDVQF